SADIQPRPPVTSSTPSAMLPVLFSGRRSASMICSGVIVVDAWAMAAAWGWIAPGDEAVPGTIRAASRTAGNSRLNMEKLLLEGVRGSYPASRHRGDPRLGETRPT